MSPDFDNENWILPTQTGQPSTVNAARPAIVTSNQFATFSEDLSVTTAGDAHQAPAVITPPHQDQEQRIDQDPPQEDDDSDDEDLPEQQQQQEEAGDKDDNDCIGLEIIMTDTRTILDLLGPMNKKPVKNPSQLEI